MKLGKHRIEVLSQQNSQAADEYAEQIRPTVEEIQRRGIITIRAICSELNRQRVPTYRNNGESWHIRTVHALLKRMRETSLRSNPAPHLQAAAA